MLWRLMFQMEQSALGPDALKDMNWTRMAQLNSRNRGWHSDLHKSLSYRETRKSLILHIIFRLFLYWFNRPVNTAGLLFTTHCLLAIFLHYLLPALLVLSRSHFCSLLSHSLPSYEFFIAAFFLVTFFFFPSPCLPSVLARSTLSSPF
jgi:hypothetical protein